MLYNKHSKKRLSYYDFRLSVLERILPEVQTIAEPKITKRGTRHFPENIEITNNEGRALRKDVKCVRQRK